MADLYQIVRAHEADEDPWLQDHMDAMEYYDFQDVLRDGMRRFRQIRDDDESWSRLVQAGKTPFNPEIARELRRRYVRWFAPCDSVLKHLQKLEWDYGAIDGAEDFKAARILVKNILVEPIDSVIEAMELVQQGRYSVV